MKKHPLSSITSHIDCFGKIVTSSTPVMDAKGNPNYPTAQVLLNFVVLVKNDQQYYRNLYTVDGTRKIAEVYLQSASIAGVKLNTIDLDKLQDNLVAINGLTTMTIVDRTQSNLTPIRRVFGYKMIVVVDGHIP